MQCKVVLALQEKAEKTCNNIRIERRKESRFYLVKGGRDSKFSLYTSDMGLLSSNENSMKESPLLCVTPSAYKMSLSEGSYSLLDISIACKQQHTNITKIINLYEILDFFFFFFGE
jgi:hypothetical protein